MLKVNEYFDGNVKSIGFENASGKVTTGVMEAGDYEFGTSSREYMTVTCGELTVKLPGSQEWKTFGKHETFIVEADKKFQLKVASPASYVCIYE